jgi:hypothetical protein
LVLVDVCYSDISHYDDGVKWIAEASQSNFCCWSKL